ncbi:bifunctional metallophosphatase/5'-nucleotidase [Virgibacillus flavescens]|uniref:bifunctional metallophosphatase/5'-nucleotidase n=1 Tax=Virgibacillus flavescens TaxID=1611422 RepID=UPI003D35151C
MDTTKVKILYTSDVHGNALPIIYGSNQPSDLGLAKYATVTKKARQENDNLLLLDNGDLIQGTPLMTHYVKQHQDKENPMIGIMNRIGIEASVIGNHEFNFGMDVLENAVQQANFPWLSVNSINRKTDQPYFGKPYYIKELNNGIKIAVLGVTTHYIPNWESPEHIKEISFPDAMKSLQKWVPHVRTVEKPDLLIVSYHGGFERDIETGEATEALTGENQGYQLCQEIEGIDILLTGHQHRSLTGMVNQVLVIQPGFNAQSYGEINVEFGQSENTWQLINKEAHVHRLDGVEPAREIVEYMTELESSTQSWLDEPVGYIDGDMSIEDPFEARINKHPFIEFIQHVQMKATGADISVTSLLNNKSKGFGPVVTMRDIVANYMYPNTLVVLALTGADIAAALEKTASYFIINDSDEIDVNPVFSEPKPQHYNYDMWEGIAYTINVNNAVGARVEDVRKNGENLDMDATYHVVLNNYRANGGGNYHMFKNKPIMKEVQQDTVELIRWYFEQHPTVKANVTKNFRVHK